MRRLSALILMIVAATASAGIAGETNEYIVMLECRGVVDEPCDGDVHSQVSPQFFDSFIATDADPVLYRLRTTARPGERFEVQIESGIESWQFSGLLTETDDGRIDVELRHTHKIESGSVATACGGRETIYDQTSIQTSVKIGLDEQIVVGGMLTHGTDEFAGRPPRSSYSREFMLLSVTRPVPAEFGD